MKTNWINVSIGIAIVGAVLFLLSPTTPRYEGFESNPGSILGMIAAGVLGVGILVGVFGGMSQMGQ